MITLANRLKYLRQSHNLTQEELGKILGVGKTTISMYENENSTPNDEIKFKISEYFDVSLDYLLGKTDIKKFTNVEELKRLLHEANIVDENSNDIGKSLKLLKRTLNDNKKLFVDDAALSDSHKNMLLSVINVILESYMKK